MADVLALVPYLPDTAGGQRTTIESWQPLLAKHGITVHLSPYESDALHRSLYVPGNLLAKGAAISRDYGRRVRSLASLSGYDAVFVYREATLVGPEIIERWTARRGLPLVYGLDDPLFI